MTALIAIPDPRRRLCQRATDRREDKWQFQRIIERPTHHIARVQIQHRHHLHPARDQADIRDVNGLIANDKFCFVRTAHLQLTAVSGVDVYRQRQARLAPQDYHPDEGSYLGGSHETAAMAASAADHTSARWPVALGSGLSLPAPLDSAADDTGIADDCRWTGGVS